MSRLFIVSNRLPVTVKVERGEFSLQQSTGGLTAALAGVHASRETLWCGWTGHVGKLEPEEQARLASLLAERRIVPVELTAAEIHHYYDGFSNGALWPLYHYLTDKVEREAWTNWRTYQEVNRRFADRVAASHRPGDVVWIHDYQLSLVPALLRERVPEARIGFFLHIPFPSFEVFRILPWREEILAGMLGADLVGFHTYSYLDHFARTLHHLLDLEGADRVNWRGREVRLGVFPIGIDAGRIERLAGTDAVRAEEARIRAETGGRRILLGLDRLDYTKGLPRRVMALARLLEREPHWKRKILYLQLVVPTRERIDAYAKLRRELEELVGRVNAQFGAVGTLPVHYLYRTLPEETLVALYRLADVMLVTPLRDGMNLVAKEFVAARTDEGGVLLLSELAGAASELVEATILNPYDLDGFARQIRRALTMKADERRLRMRSLRARVGGHDARRWAEGFLEALERPPAAPVLRVFPPSPAAERDALVAALAAARRMLLILDYDGTLVPFAETPDMALPDRPLLKLLRALATLPGTSLHLVSGRGRASLDRWFRTLPAGLHAEHGFWSRTGGSRGVWRPLYEGRPEWIERVHALLLDASAEVPGSLVERKESGIAWHYRLAEPEFRLHHAADFWRRFAERTADLPVEMIRGEKVIEFRRRGVDKGLVVSRLVADLAAAGLAGETALLAMGDDRTDEDMFRALPAGGFAVHVGPGPSAAGHRLADCGAARDLLARLLAARAGRPAPATPPRGAGKGGAG